MENSNKTNVQICDTCCLCYGAKRALEGAINAKKQGKNVVLFKEILHNKRAVQTLTSLGILVKDNLSEFSTNDYVILRAHGEGKDTYKYLQENNISYLDLTCPNVLNINKLVEKMDNLGYKIILVGKYGYKTGKMHPEVLGTSKWCNNPIFIEDLEEVLSIPLDYDKYFLVVQTTFNQTKALKIIDVVKNRLKDKVFEYKNTTCSAQRLINEKSQLLAQKVDKMIVVGGKNSSNSKELFNNLQTIVTTYFAEDLSEVKALVKENKLVCGDKIGLTGGASTLIDELQEIKDYLLGALYE